MNDPDITGRKFLLLGILFAGIGVALGAFGAHGLKDTLPGNMLKVFETAVQYQVYHALAMIAVGIIAGFHAASRLTVAAGWCFAGGTLLFSGSLYGLALTGNSIFTYVTPLGGVAFLGGWAIFLLSFVKRS